MILCYSFVLAFNWETYKILFELMKLFMFMHAESGRFVIMTHILVY
jgi:hypothetical protein